MNTSYTFEHKYVTALNSIRSDMIEDMSEMVKGGGFVSEYSDSAKNKTVNNVANLIMDITNLINTIQREF